MSRLGAVSRGERVGLSAAEAARIIGVTRQSVYRLVHLGALPKARKGEWSGLDLEAVEQAGLARVPARGGHPYFLTAREAAELLGVTRNRVHQLAGHGRIPVVEHDGRRLRHHAPDAFIARQMRQDNAKPAPASH